MRNAAAPTIALLFAASAVWAASACGSFSASDTPGDVAEGGADGPDGAATGGPRRIYVIGGEIPDTAVDAGYALTKRVFYTTQQADGTLAGWTDTNPVVSLVHGNAAVASSGAIVTLAGEVDTIGGVVAIPATSRAAILGDGALDTWADTTPLTEQLYFHASVAVNGRVYVIGGSTPRGGPLSTVRVATLAPEGTIGPWTNNAPLPVGRSRLAAATDGAHIFVVGGIPAPGTVGTCEPDVLVGTLGPNGEVVGWAPTGQRVSTQAPAAAVFANKLYVLGGFDCGGGTSKKVQIAEIHGDGTLGAFTAGTDLPVRRSGHGAVVLGQHLYAIGGNDGDTRVPDVSVANLDPAGVYDTWHPAAALPVGVSYFGVAAH